MSFWPPLAVSLAALCAALLVLLLRRPSAVRAADPFRPLFDENPQPMWIFDRETLAFLEVNDAAVRCYGYSRDEFLSMRLTDVRPPDEVPTLLEFLAGHKDASQGPVAWKHRTRDGKLLDVEVVARPLTWGGRPARLVVPFDVTERLRAESEGKRLEGQLREAQKLEAVGRLAGGVAHEFNNLLTVITGYGTLLADAVPADSALRPPLAEILRAAERAADLTRDLMAFGGRSMLRPEALDLNGLITGLERLLRPLLGEDVDLALRLGPGLPPVRADRAQLEQVLFDLTANARDAMPQGGRLALRTERTPPDAGQPGAPPGLPVTLTFSDTGPGMDEETRRRLFEPFFTSREQGRGSGLGLATVYGIVRQNGGAIEVASAPGEGTTFTIRLPAAAESAPGPAGAGGPPAGGHETVLLVEDEPGVRRLLGEVLRQHGYAVLEADNGAAALALAAAHTGPLDLVVSDVVMPGMSGPELVRRLAEGRPGLRVLYVSGHNDDAVLRRGVQRDQARLLLKPFSPAELARAVRAALDGAG